MGNLHAVAASAVTLVTTAETVVGTVGPFNENMVPQSGQGVFLEGNINITPGTGTTAVVLRWRAASLTGALIGVAQTCSVTAGVASDIGCNELDPTLVQVGAVYVLTAQQTGATANGTCNRVVVTAESASSFE